MRRRRGWLNEDEFKNVLRNFTGEITRLLRLRVLEILPVLTSILVDNWSLVLGEHIYEADAFKFKHAYIPVVTCS